MGCGAVTAAKYEPAPEEFVRAFTATTEESEPISPTSSSSVFELEKAGWVWDHYILDERGGTTGSAMVRDVRHRVTKTRWALKQYGLRGLKARFVDEVMEKLRKQAEILADLRRHPNIVSLHETYVDKNHFYIVTEWCDGGTLFNRMLETGLQTERDAASVVRQVLRAVGYMHERLVCHRDIKPENIMFKAQGPLFGCHVKVIDFNVACRIGCRGQVLVDPIGTPYYAAPQVAEGSYTERCDVWTCGVILHLMLFGYPEAADMDQSPTASRTPTASRSMSRKNLDDSPTRSRSAGAVGARAKLLKAIEGRVLDLDRSLWARASTGAHDLLRALLAQDEARRCPAKEASKHSWIVRQAAQPPGLRVQVGTDSQGLPRTRSVGTTLLSAEGGSFGEEDEEPDLL